MTHFIDLSGEINNRMKLNKIGIPNYYLTIRF